MVICCTGYQQFHHPFLPADSLRDEAPAHASEEPVSPSVDLYKFLLTPHYKHLYFLGYIELFGPLPPAVEAQARHAAALLRGRIPYPSRDAMLSDIGRVRNWQRKQFVQSERHMLTSPQIEYVDSLLEAAWCDTDVREVAGEVVYLGTQSLERTAGTQRCLVWHPEQRAMEASWRRKGGKPGEGDGIEDRTGRWGVKFRRKSRAGEEQRSEPGKDYLNDRVSGKWGMS